MVSCIAEKSWSSNNFLLVSLGKITAVVWKPVLSEDEHYTINCSMTLGWFIISCVLSPFCPHWEVRARGVGGGDCLIVSPPWPFLTSGIIGWLSLSFHKGFSHAWDEKRGILTESDPWKLLNSNVGPQSCQSSGVQQAPQHLVVALKPQISSIPVSSMPENAFLIFSKALALIRT